MSKYHNVLDASSLVKKYRRETGWEIIQELFRRSDCALHVLNITIPEVVGAFVRWELKNEIKKGDWGILKDLFINDITDYNIIIHNVTHRNIVYTDSVWVKSMPVKPPQLHDEEIITCTNCDQEIKIKKRKPRIGPNDVMVLSVASELKRIFGNNKVYLFSSDAHMLKVADKLRIKTCDPEGIMSLPF
jgi:hypothetical protein